jgi:hypothetical protein
MLIGVTREPLISRDTLSVDRDLDPSALGCVGGVRVAQRDGMVAVAGGMSGCGDGQERCGGDGSGG